MLFLDPCSLSSVPDTVLSLNARDSVQSTLETADSLLVGSLAASR